MMMMMMMMMMMIIIIITMCLSLHPLPRSFFSLSLPLLYPNPHYSDLLCFCGVLRPSAFHRVALLRKQAWEINRGKETHSAACCRCSWSTMVNWVQVFFVWWRVAWLFNSFAAPRRSERQARLPQRVKQLWPACSVLSRY